MFDELTPYTSNGHFSFDSNSDLRETCNAPKDGMGIYLVYELKNGKISLVYIGSSGKILQNGNSKTRDGGLADRIVNGIQFGSPRHESWKTKIKSEGIDALDIYWYETYNKDFSHIPSVVEANIMQRYFDVNGSLPKWNKQY